MKTLFSIGIKQTDFEIFKYKDDKDIVNVCQVSKYANKLLNEEKFWIARFFHVYGKYIGKNNIKTFKNNISWKQYYIDVSKYIKMKFPYYSSALALSRNRYDVLQVLVNMLKIKNVKPVIQTMDSVNYFYTRDGTENGIKEGIYYTVAYEDVEHFEAINPVIICKVPDRKEKVYNNNIIQSAVKYSQNKKIYEKIYQDEEAIKIFRYNKHEIKVFEEITEDRHTSIREWFMNGDIKSESLYFDNKKNGIWNKWNKKGEKITKYYSDGKLVPYITPWEETRVIHEYFSNLRQQYEAKRK